MQSGMVNYEEALDPLLEPIDTVVQHPDNYNNGAVEEIVESIVTNGMYRPIIVNRESKEIIAGNHTWMACKELGAEVIPVVWVGGDDLANVRRMLGDNKIASLARIDHGQELELLERLQEADALLGTGYKDYDVEAIRALNEIPQESPDFAQWPVLCFQVPPHVKSAFEEMTEVAGGERERFEMLLRLAGWDGRKP